MPRKTTENTMNNLHLSNGSKKSEEVLRKILWSIETGETKMNKIPTEYSLDEYDELYEWYGDYTTKSGNVWGITIRKERLPMRAQSKSFLVVETTKRTEKYTGQFAAKAVSMMFRNEKIAGRNKKNLSRADLDDETE